MMDGIAEENNFHFIPGLSILTILVFLFFSERQYESECNIQSDKANINYYCELITLLLLQGIQSVHATSAYPITYLVNW